MLILGANEAILPGLSAETEWLDDPVKKGRTFSF
jgi:hypothetical protein